MCTVVLKNRKYGTRGTHGKVSVDRSFQSPLELEDIVRTFTDLRDEWEGLYFACILTAGSQCGPWFRDTDPSSTGHDKITLSKVSCSFSSRQVEVKTDVTGRVRWEGVVSMRDQNVTEGFGRLTEFVPLFQILALPKAWAESWVGGQARTQLINREMI